MTTFKEFFLENRDRKIFLRIAQDIEQHYSAFYNSRLPKFEQVFNITLYSLWKYFDYSVSVLASQKSSKAHITYNNLCSLISNKMPTDLTFKREIIGQIIEVMIYMGIIIEKSEYNEDARGLFGIKDVLLGISEKEVETLDDFKTRMRKSENADVLDDENYMLDLYISAVLNQVC